MIKKQKNKKQIDKTKIKLPSNKYQPSVDELREKEGNFYETGK